MTIAEGFSPAIFCTSQRRTFGFVDLIFVGSVKRVSPYAMIVVGVERSRSAIRKVAPGSLVSWLVGRLAAFCAIRQAARQKKAGKSIRRDIIIAFSQGNVTP